MVEISIIETCIKVKVGNVIKDPILVEDRGEKLCHQSYSIYY